MNNHKQWSIKYYHSAVKIFWVFPKRQRVRVVKELVLKANGLRPREFKSRLCRFWILYAKSICCKKKCCCYIFWYFWTIVFVVKFLAYIISINLCHFVFHTFFFLCRFFSLCVLNTLSYFLIYYKKWYK